MNARHIEERRELFMGEELVYYVTVIDPCPEPSQENPYGEGGRCVADPLAPRPNCDVPSGHAPERRVPSKAEYIRSFANVGKLPECVRDSRAGVEARLDGIARYFRLTDRRPNARLARALAWYDAADLTCVYDAGRTGRIHHYFEAHKRRAAR